MRGDGIIKVRIWWIDGDEVTRGIGNAGSRFPIEKLPLRIVLRSGGLNGVISWHLPSGIRCARCCQWCLGPLRIQPECE